MQRLKTRLDLNKKLYYWSLDDSVREYPYLQELLDDSKLTFSDESAVSIIITIPEQRKVLAKLRYQVTYDGDTDTVSLSGLLGVYTGPAYDTFMRFGNDHIKFATDYGASARFLKNYKTEPKFDKKK